MPTSSMFNSAVAPGNILNFFFDKGSSQVHGEQVTFDCSIVEGRIHWKLISMRVVKEWLT